MKTLSILLLVAVASTEVEAQQKTYELAPRYYIAHSDASSATIVTPFAQTVGYSPSWSPDAARIAFAWNGDIFVMDAAGENTVNLTNDPGKNWGPAWSPDGRGIAYHRHVDGGGSLFVMNADGSAPGQLATRTDAQWAVSHAYAANGTCTVWLTVSDSLGVSSRFERAVTASEPSIVHAGDLEGYARQTKGGLWDATASVLIHSTSHKPIAAAT